MFCTNCGAEVTDYAVFCSKCGIQIKKVVNETNQPSEPVMNQKKEKHSKGLIAAMIGGIALIAVVGILACVLILSRKDDKGERNDEAFQRDDQVETITSEAADITAEAEITEDQLGAELDKVLGYLQNGDYDGSEELLSSLVVDSSSANAVRYQQLRDIVDLNLQLTAKVDVSNYPTITLSFTCKQSNIRIEASDVTIIDNGAEIVEKEIVQEGNSLMISYNTTAGIGDINDGSVIVKIKLYDNEFEYNSYYTPPVLKQANIKIVSSDVSEYPKIKLYARIEDATSMETIEGLTSGSLVIKEAEGGEYLAREVYSLEQLKGNRGLSIGLLADKSGSMQEEFYKVQEVMQEFVHSLDFANGDEVEIIAFDSYVMYMCTYTNDVALLENGINNMSTYGETALYDALISGIKDARYQTGAKCVIAFTDGYDTTETSPEIVVNKALEYSVPVYIIGTSGADEATLKDIAQRTGGYYWNINDLYDMNEILQEIYVEQKDMYCIEYITKESIDKYAKRDINIILSDLGYGTNISDSFTPIEALVRSEHTSEYELIMDDISWEEANQKCKEMGGHLASITSQEEMDIITELAEKKGAKYVWLGGYTSVNNNQVYGHWITGEAFDFTAWYPDEPSRNDMDGTPEMYLMLWCIKDQWSWNDQRNDPIKDTGLKYFNGKTAYVCEYDK